MQHTGARTFYLPSADYIWPHVMNRKVHEVASANGGRIVGEEYFPIDHADWGETVDRINSQRRGRRVQHDRASRVLPVPRGALRVRLHQARRA